MPNRPSTASTIPPTGRAPPPPPSPRGRRRLPPGGPLGSPTWPALPTRTPAPASDPGAPPILVVGTTQDPVTPYAWAVSLAHQLSGGVLLSWQGQSHVRSF